MATLGLAAEAAALKARYGALLAGGPGVPAEVTIAAESALDAARARLQGGERPAAGQLALDLRAVAEYGADSR